MQTIFTVISLLVTLMTGGFVLRTDSDLVSDSQTPTASSQAEDETDGGPEADPFG